jgi:3-dehydroquinate dehydratase
MNSYKTLIAVLGWEDRFCQGIENDLRNYNCQSLILLRYQECIDITNPSRIKIEQLCSKKNIELKYIDITDDDPVSKWKILEKYFADQENVGDSVLLDISTMPRETIWTILFFIHSLNIKVDYIYYTPLEYNKDWLSREPGKPRLLFKHSGITKLGNPTALIILTGFEIERAKQLVYFFEPKLTLLGFQEGKQFDNDKRNKEIHELIKGFTETTDFSINAYSEDNGYSIINSQIESLKTNYNVIITSLGPKPTAISIYKAFLSNPEIALSYVPAKEFNKDYSSGIDKTIFGRYK